MRRGGSVWRSVRKIRSLAEFKILLRVVTEKAEGTNAEDLRNLLHHLRSDREQERLRITKFYDRKLMVTSTSDVLDYLVRDMLGFAKVTGLYRRQGDRYVATPLAHSLSNAVNEGEHIAKTEILRFLFDCPYKSYLEFLRTMIHSKGSIELPPHLSGRRESAELRQYIESRGFLTDIASFFTLRDLYYDIGILNWFRDQGQTERMYLTNDIIEFRRLFKKEDELGISRLAIEDPSTILVWESLLLHYSNSGPLGHYANLFEIRDMVCSELKLSDQRFQQFVSSVPELASSNGYRVAMGSTPLLSNLPMGYVVKLLTLPTIDQSQPATRIQINFVGN